MKIKTSDSNKLLPYHFSSCLSSRNFYSYSLNFDDQKLCVTVKQLSLPIISDQIKRSDRERARVRYGEAERRTLLNLIQAIDKKQVLLSGERSAPHRIAKHELWKQVTDSFNDITGRNTSIRKLHGVLKRTKRNDCKAGKYLEYDQDLKRWIFL